METDDFEELTRVIAEADPKIIGIDGYFGVGKSYLSDSLRKGKRFAYFPLDEVYLDKKKGTYQSSPKKIILLTKGINGRFVNSNTAIFDGVLLRSALLELGIKEFFHIYIKKLDQDGFWEHKWFLDDEKPDFEFSALDEQLIEYHKKFEPHKRADVVFLNKYTI